MAGEWMDLRFHHTRRSGVPRGTRTIVQMLHDRVHKRSGTTHTRYAAHGCAAEISDPDAHGEFGREAESPIVAVVGTGAGFAGGGKIEAQGGVCTEGRGTSFVIVENVGDEPAGAGIGDEPA